MLKKAVQQGRSERRPEAYPRGYVEGLNDARTLLADFFSSLLGLVGELCQPCPGGLGGGAVGVTTKDLFVQFLGVGPVVLAFFEPGGFKQLRRLVWAAGRSHQKQWEDNPDRSSVHVAVPSQSCRSLMP